MLPFPFQPGKMEKRKMEKEKLIALTRAGNRAELARAFKRGELENLGETVRRELCSTAARYGQAGVLKDFFTLYHLHCTEPDAQGRTLLHDAVSSGDPATIAFAMDVIGLDPMEGDSAGRTALEEAHAAERPDGYQFLTKRLGFQLEECYRNPVLRGFHPDPSILRVGEDYYLVNSSFVFFPGLPIFHSRDLVNWQLIGHAAENFESCGLAGLPGGFGYWAPDISFYHGKYWVVATLRRDTPPYRLQMITSARDPAGPWAPPRFLPLDGIDPSLFTDGERRYILLNPGAILAEINDAGEVISEPEMIFFGDAKIKPEGPHLLKKDGWYYLFLAEGGTGDGHMETVMRSRNLKGPYEACPFNPILGRKNPRAYIQRSGHGKPVSTPDGRWYMVYLCGRKIDGKTMLGRETAMDPMTWTADGWPMVNGLKGPSCLQMKPYPEMKTRPALAEEWISPRNNPAAFTRMTGTEIIMRCGPDPAEGGACSLLLRRQREACFHQRVHVDLSGCAENSQGGLTGYYDEHSFFLFLGRKKGAGMEITVIEQIGTVRSERKLIELPQWKATFSVIGEGLQRRLICEEAVNRELCCLQTDYLSDEGLQGGKRFTGALYGLAAIGDGEIGFTERN